MLPKFMNISDIGLKNNNCLSVWGIGKKKNFSYHGPSKRKTYKKSNSPKKKKKKKKKKNNNNNNNNNKCDKG